MMVTGRESVGIDDEDAVDVALEVPARTWWSSTFRRSPDLGAQMAEAVSAVRPPRTVQYIAVLGGKGGAGKTTTSTALGSVFAAKLRERVVVVDANPDKGTLKLKMPMGQQVRPLHLLAGRTDQIHSHAQLDPYLLRNDVGLDAMVSSRRRDVRADEGTYREVLTSLRDDYRVVIADCGTSSTSGAARAVFAVARQLVLVTPARVDGFYGLLETIDELVDLGLGDLVGEATAVITGVSATSSVDVDKMHADLKRRCAVVRRVPWDPHLDAGAALDFAVLQPETKVAYARIAATVTARFR